MISKLLKSNHPIVFIFILILSIGLWLLSFINPIGMNIYSDYNAMPLALWLNKTLPVNTNLSAVIAFIILFLQALLLIQFNKRFIVIKQRTYLPAFLYIFISSAFIPLQRLNPVVFGMFFIYWAVYYIFSIYRKDFALNKLYIAAFFIGIATLFWVHFALFFILLIISLVILRPFVGREWMVSILGFLTPLFFTFVYYYVFRDEVDVLNLLWSAKNSFQLVKDFHQIHNAYYIFFFLIFLLIIAASFSILNNFQKKKIMVRKFFTLCWWIFFVYFLAYFVIKNIGYEVLFVISIPISFLLSDYFYAVRREKILSLIIYLLIISAAYIQIIAHF